MHKECKLEVILSYLGDRIHDSLDSRQLQPRMQSEAKLMWR